MIKILLKDSIKLLRFATIAKLCGEKLQQGDRREESRGEERGEERVRDNSISKHLGKEREKM